jgi:ABA4-like protein
MNPDFLFRIANNLALFGWLVLIFLPRWRWAARLVGPVLIPVPLSAIYATLVINVFGHAGGGFTSLSSVALLFQNRYILLAGWVHYLAFDLFVGSWEVRDAQRIGIAHHLVVPCLILTFLFGPAGWLLYFLVRTVATRSIGMNDNYAESMTGIASS